MSTAVEPQTLAELRQRVAGSQSRELHAVVTEIKKRRCEALKLYEPMEHIDAFHACDAPERILRGSNRSGKTLGAAVEFARAVTGQDPYNKWPKSDGLAYVVGASNHHIGSILHRMLFRAGAFKMIQDKETGEWRAFRPWEPDDAARKNEAKPAPPLIPPRLIKSMSWENKKESVVKVVLLVNGWEIQFCPSGGVPPQGFQADLAWFDEEIVLAEPWYGEVAARGLVDRQGKFFWSATAQKGGPKLYQLSQKAEEQKYDDDPKIVEFFAHIDDNKYFTKEQRELFFQKLSEEERLIRVEGEFAYTQFRVWPEFDRRTHGIDYFDIPADWTRYAVVDPGRQVCAVLFAALPPPDHRDPGMVVLYDELYIRNSTARKFGEEFTRKARENEFQAFLIDHQGARVRDAGRGYTVEEQYSAELKRHKIKSRATGYGFHWGSTDWEGGLEMVRSWLLIRQNGKPKLLYFHDRMYNFWKEMSNYHYKRERMGFGELKNEPEKRHDHLCDCMRYLAMFDPKYVRPSRFKGASKTLYEYVMEKKRKAARLEGKEGVSLGATRGAV